MIYDYAKISRGGQSVDAKVRQLRNAGCQTVFREVAGGAKTDRATLAQLVAQLAPDAVVVVTPLNRLARSTRDALNTLAAINGKGAAFRSLGGAWADTTTPQGRFMLTVLGGLV